MFDTTWADAFKYVNEVRDCSPSHGVAILRMEVAANPEPFEYKDWERLHIMLGNAYLSLECYEQAERQFSLLVGNTKFREIEAQAKAGLDRALAGRSRESHPPS